MVSQAEAATIRPLRRDFPGVLDAALRPIHDRARGADRDGCGLAGEIRLLAEAGLLQACLPASAGGTGLGLGEDPRTTLAALRTLRRLGRASLSVARLFEGHLNAVKLAALYGRPEHRARTFAAVQQGALLGVWGADGRTPLTFTRQAGGMLRLEGGKCFASGLGLVSHAVVTLRESPDAPSRLAVIEVTDLKRQDVSAWDAAGMRATASGVFDFSGLILTEDALLGEPGDYEREPHFEGGIWRYCAAQLGGAEAIVAEWRKSVLARERADDPFQLTRLARATALCRAAGAMLQDCAPRVEAARDGGPDEVDRAVLGALLARQVVEETCVEVMTLAERSLGVEAHLERSPVERMRRDLSLYIRQSAPDAKLLRAGRLLCRIEDDDAW